MNSKYVITFGFNGDEGFQVQNTKPIPANDEQEACEILIDQFENYEGIPIDILQVTKQ
jgi:hypothetical protein